MSRRLCSIKPYIRNFSPIRNEGAGVGVGLVLNRDMADHLEVAFACSFLQWLPQWNTRKPHKLETTATATHTQILKNDFWCQTITFCLFCLIIAHYKLCLIQSLSRNIYFNSRSVHRKKSWSLYFDHFECDWNFEYRVW